MLGISVGAQAQCTTLFTFMFIYFYKFIYFYVYLFYKFYASLQGLLHFDYFGLGVLLMHAWSFMSLGNGFTLALWGTSQGFICH